jgi:hypothetical protein
MSWLVEFYGEVEILASEAETAEAAAEVAIARVREDGIHLHIFTEAKIESGLCRYCGCTDLFACAEGCSWLDPEHTVCSNLVCWGKYLGDQAKAMPVKIPVQRVC